jgi:predicted RNA-binding Zn ribbon-like protein
MEVAPAIPPSAVHQVEACACFDLVNSEVWYGLGPLEDRLASDAGWLDEFLARWRLAAPGRRTRKELDELARLRSLLRRLIETVAAGRRIADSDLAELNGFLVARPLRRTLAPSGDGYELALTPLRSDWTYTLAEIATSFAELAAGVEVRRIKVCPNPECRWVFYDETKNRRRRWCESAICGNRDKVRRFRERTRARG